MTAVVPLQACFYITRLTDIQTPIETTLQYVHKEHGNILSVLRSVRSDGAELERRGRG